MDKIGKMEGMNNDTGDRILRKEQPVLIIIGSLLLAAGSIVPEVTYNRLSRRITNTYFWEKTESVVEKRMLYPRRRIRRTEYYWSIKYKYMFGGKEYTSKQYSLLKIGPYLGSISATSDDFQERKEKLIKEHSGEYSEGSKQICYVNPDNPEEALLVLVMPTIKNTFMLIWIEFRQLCLCVVLLLAGIVTIRCGMKKKAKYADELLAGDDNRLLRVTGKWGDT